MYQRFDSKQLILAGKAKDIKKAINSITASEKKNETLQRYLLQRPKMCITVNLK